MADLPLSGPRPARRWPALRHLLANRQFQKWAARFPLTRGRVRREGEALFDIVAGFCHSQVLMAFVTFDLPGKLMGGPMTLTALAASCAVPEARMRVLMQAAVALGLVRRRRGDRYGLSQRGAALAGVPGLTEMIRHHDVLYRDLADPVAFFRGETQPELAGFWPYVFGGAVAPDVARTYSDLMAESQLLVAEDTLDAVPLKGVRHLLDVGGGTGAFLAEVGDRWPALRMTLFDLPPVAPEAAARFARRGMADRVEIVTGSFRSDSLPEGADAISLVRVLYDHADETIADLLAKCFAALPPGGTLLISEPMAGGARPQRAGDAYFALYTLAMETGKARSADEIAQLCRAAGFARIAMPRARRPFVTSCLVARKPDS
ncbi:MAG: methyltransferase [Sulfitobacter sp.]|nr:methyltransferase [Sulfitobacter sp.]